ncbi:hypothetical protein [Nitrospira sp. ND1]|uniref:hypothetical protein n=1 Tax=Nitrospira sp. ND1 TaxID=1658518 RepID=UPI00117C7E3E|nr:hypothetical protein [Nitrospira sp. ND1]
MIRIYPDDIHVDGHEQPLTAKESAAWGSYWNRLRAPTTSDRHTALDLWRQLVAEVGLRRALYLATLDDAKRVGRRPLAWCTSPKASCLPDRFIAHIWLSEPDSLEYRRPDLIIPALNLVTEPLFLGPDPWRDTADTSLLGSAAAWMHDFKAALVAGMGIDVNLGSPDAIVHRLVVVGVRASVAGQAQADEFAALLRAHELTNGLDICPPGSATNALPGERPLYTSTPSLEQLFDDQLVGSLAPPRRPMRKYQHMEPTSPSPGIDRRTASYRLSFALGLPPQALGYVEHGAAVRDDKRGPAVDLRRVIRMLVEPAMRTALGDQVSNDALGSVLSRYEAANQLEPLPNLMIGEQPYGVLPILVQSSTPPQGFDRVLSTLRREVFAPAVAKVPRVGNLQGQPALQVLLDILRTDAHIRQIKVRLALSGTLAETAATRLPQAERNTLNTARLGTIDLLTKMGMADPARAPGLDMIYIDPAPLSRIHLVAPADAEERDQPQTYLAWLHEELSLDDILNENYPPLPVGRTDGKVPKSILFHLCRQAVLMAAHADMLERYANPTSPLAVDVANNPEKFDADGQHWATISTEMNLLRVPRQGPHSLLYAPVPDASRSVLIHQLLGRLRQADQSELEAALGEALGPLTHRLDSWLSLAAAEQIGAIRNDGRLVPFLGEGYPAGLGIGAYGLVCRIERGNTVSAGHVLAPGLNHAAAAGVLLSADLADWVSRRGSSYATDLSSSRIRVALDLLDGVANGQPLAALLGYRIERSLVEAQGTAPSLIAPLRAVAPLVAHRLTQGAEPMEDVAANNVVDGLVLLALATREEAIVPDVVTLKNAFISKGDDSLTNLTAMERDALQAALVGAADGVNAMSDLLLSEGVFQLVRGSSARARAAANAMSGAPVPPGDIEVARTPLRGDAVQHRIITLLDSTTVKPGWDQTPRAVADPAANAWVASLLPAPSAIRFLVKIGTPPQTHETNLAEMLQNARDPQSRRTELALSPLDVLLFAQDIVPDPSGQLEQRFFALAELMRPKDQPNAPIQIDFDRSSDWPIEALSLRELLALAVPLRAWLCGCRPLLPTDLPVDGAVDGADQVDRLDKARNDVNDVVTNLKDVSAIVQLAALRRAELVGASAGRVLDLNAQVQAVHAELEARLNTNTAGKGWRECMKILLGASQPAVPVLSVASESVRSALETALGTTPGDLRRFLQRASRVRGKVADLEAALSSCEMVTGNKESFSLAVAQTPWTEGERWVGLKGHAPVGRTGIVAVSLSTGSEIGKGESISGLFVDEWNEVIPADSVQGAAAFHYNAPSTAAPNAILLCTPPLEGWRLPDLVAAVNEAFHLAQMRAVDPDLLGAVGQLLPALLLRDRMMPGSLLQRLSVAD